MINTFENIKALAAKRKGGDRALALLLSDITPNKILAKKGDDRFLSTMARCVFQAGFNWQVIAKKWPGFEEAFHQFDPQKLSYLSSEEWHAFTKDKRIVRNGQKIKALRENTKFLTRVAQENGSFASFIANWPEHDQIGLLDYLKKHGSRLGGNTGQYFLRFVGKDCFILSRDVTSALRLCGLDISDNPTTKRERQLAQNTFNSLHKETGLPFTHISQILAFSNGQNYDNGLIEQNRQGEL